MRNLLELTLIYPVVLFVVVGATAAQSPQAKSVKWQPVIGYQKEFVVFMPIGFKTVVDDRLRNFGKSRTQLVAVKKTVRTARLINGTLLLMNYYEANARALSENLSASSELSPVSEMAAGSFRVKRFAGKVRNQYVKTHYFIGKDRMYEAKIYSRDENDPIGDAFLASVRVVDGDSYTAPNAEGDDTSTPMPRLQEIEPERSPDTVRVDESDVDRSAIILFQPSLQSSSEQGVMPPTGKMTTTAVLSASGVVTDVKTVGNTSLELQRAFAKTIANIVFIPAEKDGKLVSVIKTFTWEMTVEVRGILPVRIQ